MSVINDGFRFNTWWGIGDAWSAKTTYGTTDNDENRFYVGGTSTRGRTRLGFTIPTSYAGPTELIIGMRPDQTSTISYMRALLTTNGSVDSNADNWASTSILASSYFYSDQNCTTRITGETVNWVYCKLTYNFTPGTTYYVGIFPYASSTSVGNTNYSAVWFRGRNAADYLWSRLTYQGTYTVTYNANGGTGTMSPSTATYNSSFMTRKNAFTRVGYIFNGWNERADGTGTAWGLSSAGVYESGKSWIWTYTRDITLYAQWKIETYTISYDKNGYTTTGSFPSSQTKTYGTNITLSTVVPTIPSATVTGFKVTLDPNGGTCSTSSLTSQRLEKRTFKSWNTNTSGTGTSYAAGATYSSNRNITLYLIVNKTYTNYSVTLPTPTRTGYDFLGWAANKTAASGTTGTYTPTSNITLYAIWKIKTYTISYDANGGKGAPAPQIKTYGVDIKLSTTVPTRDKVVDQSKTVTVTFNANGGTCDVASKEGVAYTVYAFVYWAHGNTATFTPGQTYNGNHDLQLFARWSSSTERSSVSLPVASKDEYVFLGWSTDQTADNIISGSYTPDSNITLYAIYQKDIPKLDYYSLYLGSSRKNVYLGSKEYKVVVPPVSTR